MKTLVLGGVRSAKSQLASALDVGREMVEPGHEGMQQALEAEPLLDLGMRLGEGSGAAVAVARLRQTCALHNEMATFAEAGVSEA